MKEGAQHRRPMVLGFLRRGGWNQSVTVGSRVTFSKAVTGVLFPIHGVSVPNVDDPDRARHIAERAFRRHYGVEDWRIRADVIKAEQLRPSALARGSGVEVLASVSSFSEALSALRHRTPDLAIIDFKLKDETATALVLKLRARGVPVVVHLGIPRLSDLPPEFDDVPWIEKPIARAELLKTMAGLRCPAPTAST